MRRFVDDCAEGERYTVWLNGQEAPKCFGFDTYHNTVWCWQTDDQGKYVVGRDADGRAYLPTNTRYGTVTYEQWWESVDG